MTRTKHRKPLASMMQKRKKEKRHNNIINGKRVQRFKKHFFKKMLCTALFNEFKIQIMGNDFLEKY